MLTQRRWRIAGGILLAISGGMAVFSARISAIRVSPTIFAAYWGVFLLAFGLAVLCALLDLRYIRLRMALEERELYRQTLGDEAFRKALREAQEEMASKPKGNRTS